MDIDRHTTLCVEAANVNRRRVPSAAAFAR
jgi:hypothetical protein